MGWGVGGLILGRIRSGTNVCLCVCVRVCVRARLNGVWQEKEAGLSACVRACVHA